MRRLKGMVHMQALPIFLAFAVLVVFILGMAIASNFQFGAEIESSASSMEIEGDQAVGSYGSGSISASYDDEDSPVLADSSWQLTGFSSTGAKKVWRYMGDCDVQECGEHVLACLEDSGWSMVSSGYLDYSESSWGCVCKHADDSESVMVTALPDSSDSDDAKIEIEVSLYGSELL